MNLCNYIMYIIIKSKIRRDVILSYTIMSRQISDIINHDHIIKYMYMLSDIIIIMYIYIWLYHTIFSRLVLLFL